MKFSVKLHIELGDYTLMHYILLFLDPDIPPYFLSIDSHQHQISHILWSSYRPNQSGKIQCGTHIPLLKCFWILTVIVHFHMWFLVRLPVFFAVLDNPSPHSSWGNLRCLKCVQGNYPHHFQQDDCQILVLGGYSIIEFVLQGGHFQTMLVTQGIFGQFKCTHTILLKVWRG
jgi:hypothetical protein